MSVCNQSSTVQRTYIPGTTSCEERLCIVVIPILKRPEIFFINRLLEPFAGVQLAT